MKKYSWMGITAAIAILASCSHPQKYTSDMGSDTPVSTGGQRVGTEMPGAEGPVADQSRLPINHRSEAKRERMAQKKLVSDPERKRRTEVTDNTYTRSSAPVAGEGVKKPKPKKVVSARVNRPAEPAAVKTMNRELALNQLHHINQKEIAMAKLAESRAEKEAVKNAAASIRRDHEALEAKVEDVAKKRDVTLASFQANTFEGVAENRLEGLKGTDFDYAFTQGMEDGHRVATAQLLVLRNRATDPEVIALINETMPKVRNHQKHSQNVLGSIQTDERTRASR